MAKLTLSFEDTKTGGLDIALDVVDETIETDKDIPYSYMMAGLINYIIEQGYHEQYIDEFIDHANDECGEDQE